MDDASIQMTVPPAEAMRAVREAAGLWGAAWEPGISGGRIALPVVAGLRRLVLEGEVTVKARSGGSSVRLAVLREAGRSLNRPALVILLLGGAGGLTATAWPFYPPLLAVTPLALVLAFAAWFMVASRVRTTGPQDFLDLVARVPEGWDG